MIEISVTIPIYNEAMNLQSLYARLSKVLAEIGVSYELIFADDGSSDNSLEIIKSLAAENKEVNYLSLSRNFGHQIAVSAALDVAKGNAIVIIDADLQDPPEIISDLYAKLKEGYEVVYAKRKSRKGESFLKKLTAKIFYRLLWFATSIKIPLDVGDFRIIDRKVLDYLKKMPEPNKFLRGQIAWLGFRQTFIEYHRAEREAGETAYTYGKMFNLAINAIVSFSNIPIRMVTISGFFVASVSFLMAVYAYYKKTFTDDYVIGWASLMISILFLGGVQLISIGIIGEYISKINDNTKARPLYAIKESNL